MQCVGYHKNSADIAKIIKDFFVQNILYISVRGSLKSKTSLVAIVSGLLLLIFKKAGKFHSETAVVIYVGTWHSSRSIHCLKAVFFNSS